MTKIRAIRIGVLLSTFVAFGLVAQAAGGGPRALPALPPDGVFTCAWIAAHPTDATALRVSCREDMTNNGANLAEARAMQINLSRSGLGANGFHVMSDGCSWVPGPGAGNYISPGVYAATGFDYSNTRTWSASTNFETYHWWIKRTDDSVYDHAQSGGGPGSRDPIPSNVYRWQVRNDGSSASNWVACWDDD